MQPEEPNDQESVPPPKSASVPEPETPPSPEAESARDIHRLLWERTRLSRVIEVIALQGILWGNLFVFKRGTFTGAGAIIPWVVVAIIAIYLPISVTRFGNLIDMILMLVYSFTLLTATFSTLYWNYGTTVNFSDNLTRLDAVYFTVGTLTTAGTGNISAISETARGIQTLQMVLDIGLVVFAFSIVIAELSARMQRARSGHG